MSEVYLYQCSQCGFSHRVPAYWMSFEPEDSTEHIHINLDTGVFCTTTQLEYKGETQMD